MSYRIVVTQLPGYNLITVEDENGLVHARKKVRWNDEIIKNEIIKNLQKEYKIS